MRRLVLVRAHVFVWAVLELDRAFKRHAGPSPLRAFLNSALTRIREKLRIHLTVQDVVGLLACLGVLDVGPGRAFFPLLGQDERGTWRKSPGF